MDDEDREAILAAIDGREGAEFLKAELAKDANAEAQAWIADLYAD